MKDSQGGIALMSGRVKIHGSRSNWNERIQAAVTQKERDLVIVTYSLPKIDSYLAQKLLTKRKGKTALIYHEKFSDNIILQYLLDEGVNLYPCSDIHGKVALISPDLVVIGSENFVYSDWIEYNVTIKDQKGYDYVFQDLSEYLGCNPITREPVKSCKNCLFNGRGYNICGNGSSMCNSYRRIQRKDFSAISLALDKYWQHPCRNCKHLQPCHGTGFVGYVCPIMSKYFPQIRKNASDPDVNIDIECRYWEKGAIRLQVENHD